jgi:hypothetical protein
MKSTQDFIDVMNVVHLDFLYADSKDFDAEQELWAEELTLDYGGVNPEAEGVVSAERLKDTWGRQLGPLDLTQHLLSNQIVTVDGDEASVTYYLQSLHYHAALGENQATNTYTHHGRGTHGLRRIDGSWKVVSVRFRLVHSTGNANMIPEVLALDAA